MVTSIDKLLEEHDHTDPDYQDIPNAGLVNSDITINANNALSGGGTVNLGNSVDIAVDSDAIGSGEIDETMTPTWEGTHAWNTDTGTPTVLNINETGIYYNTSNSETLDIRNKGSGDVTIKSQGAINLSNSDSIQDSGTDAIQFDGSANVTLGGDVFVAGSNTETFVSGNSSAVSYTSATPKNQILGDGTNDDNKFLVGSWGGTAPQLWTFGSGGTNIGDSGSLSNGDSVGRWFGFADDGSGDLHQTAVVRMQMDGTVGTDATPGRIIMETTPDGASTTSEALRIDSNQRLGVQTTPSTVLDTSGVAENWRINTGQSIEDGSGTNRVSIRSAGTTIRDDDGQAGVQLDSGSYNRIWAESGQPIIFRDAANDHNAVQYTTGNPGTLELTNANLVAPNTIKKTGATIEPTGSAYPHEFVEEDSGGISGYILLARANSTNSYFKGTLYNYRQQGRAQDDNIAIFDGTIRYNSQRDSVEIVMDKVNNHLDKTLYTVDYNSTTWVAVKASASQEIFFRGARSDEANQLNIIDSGNLNNISDIKNDGNVTDEYLSKFQTGNLIMENGNIHLATGQAIGDGSGTERATLFSNSTVIRDSSGDAVLDFDDGGDSEYRIFSRSAHPLKIHDSEGDSTAVQYDTDKSAGVLRTPNADVVVEDYSGLTSDGIQIGKGSGNTLINSRESSSFVPLDIYASRLDLSGNAANLRIAEGQAIEDGSGTLRFSTSSGATYLYNASGSSTLHLDSNFVKVDGQNLRLTTGQAIEDGSGESRMELRDDGTYLPATSNSGQGSWAYFREGQYVRFYAGSSEPLQIRDGEMGAVSVQYDTDSSAGVLRTPNAGIRVESGIKSYGDGLNLLSNTTPELAYHNGTSLQSRIQLKSSLIDISNTAADLRIAEGQTIEDGSGDNRLSVLSSGTFLQDDGGSAAFEGDSGNHNRIWARSGQPVQIQDGNGGFTAVQYKTSDPAPGTLELSNATLDMDDHNIVSIGRLSFDAQSYDYIGTESGEAEIFMTDGSSWANDGDVLIGSHDTGNNGTASAVLFDWSDGTVSSERYKDGLRPFDNEVDPYQVLDVEAKAWNHKGNDSLALGFSADELYSVHPHYARTMILREDDDWADEQYMDKWGYDYGDEIPNQPRQWPVIASHHEILRDLMNRIEELEEEIAD